MISFEARDCQWTSCFNSQMVTAAKYLTAFWAGWPSGLSNPAATRMGMSWELQPRSHEASSAVNRAGKFRRLRNCSLWEFMRLFDLRFPTPQLLVYELVPNDNYQAHPSQE